MKKQLILIGGLPGSGKTYIGKKLAQKLGLFIDKDTLTQDFTTKILELLGSHANDRESEIYLKGVRNLEYETMLKHALENIALGHTVICSAPFLQELTDSRWLSNVNTEANLLNAEVITIWIYVDFPTAYQRLMSRGDKRDSWKLRNWEAYIRNIPKTLPTKSISITMDNSEGRRVSILEQIESVIQALKKHSGS